MGAVPLLIGTAAAGLAAGGYQSKRQHDVMVDEKHRVKREEERLSGDMAAREAQAKAQQGFQLRKDQQRARALLAGGTQGTIKSGSKLGIPGGGNTYGKATLIGGSPSGGGY